jgi:Domain of unknown function (DUF1707)
MSISALDPMIHNPQRLRIVATLAALPNGDTLSVSRLQTMIGLPPGSPIIGLSELVRAGYIRTEPAADGTPQATAALTGRGRAALGHYTAALAQLPQEAMQPPAPGLRAGDADRDVAAAALAEHFAQGRLTLDELIARLDATLTATTHGELAQASTDLPDLTALSGPVGLRGGKRAGSRSRPRYYGKESQRDLRRMPAAWRR